MKIRVFRRWTWLLGGSASLLVLVLGCQISHNSVSAQPIEGSQTNNAVVSVTETNSIPDDIKVDGTNAAPMLEADDSSPENFKKPAQTDPVLPVDLSPGVAQVAKLVQAHVTDDVILSYIRNSTVPYRPTADEIVYLNDLGVSQAVLTELINRGKSAWEPAEAPEVAQNPLPGSVTDAAESPAPAPAPATTDPAAPTYSVNAEQPVPAPTEAPPAPATVAVVPPQPVQTVSVDYARDYLSPYGSWVFVEDYGWCWRPSVTVVNPEWRPYCDRGRWVYTDCGWYWESDYSWGWVAFHYGRWWQHGGFGWVWVPGTVWGPSWVSWRHHDNYCGWAPLPPRAHFEVGIGLTFNHHRVAGDFGFGLHADAFTFVAYDHFRDRQPGHFRLPAHEATAVYHNSTVINNYTVINRTRVVNEGIGRERVATLTHQPIQPVSIRHVSGTGAETRMERVDRASHTLSVYHPTPATVSPRSGSTPGAVHTAPPVTINRAPQRTSPTSMGHPTVIAGRGDHSGAVPNSGVPSRTDGITVRRMNEPAVTTHPRSDTLVGRVSDVPGSATAPTRPTPTPVRPGTAPTVTRVSPGSGTDVSHSPSVPVSSRGSTPSPSSHSTTLPPNQSTVLPPTRSTIVQPERPAIPATPSRSVTIPTQPATPAMPTRTTTVAPARTETPAVTARPAVTETPRPAFTPRSDTPSRSTPDSRPASPTPSYSAPRPVSPSVSAPRSTPQPSMPQPSTRGSSPGSVNPGRYGSGNR